ncbi:MAG: Crp/Fnr family transcriptional regulator [Gemmatimonadetes bacterium]|nr:Crp/Fnr family transcriptional regulator [Gemmatimonadota bacterium]
MTTAISTLRTVPLFARLRESDLENLLRILRARDYAKNSVILFAHDPSDAFYVLLSGQVKVMLIAEDGREVILSLVHPGDFFGERSLLDDEPHSASVIAMEDSRLLILRRDDFQRCIHEMPGIAFGLLRALCARLQEADSKIGGLILLDVTGRVCHLLLQLADRGDGKTISDPPTHQIMAQMVGSSRETVSRTMGSLADQGLISVSRREITILSREALEVAAGHLLRKRSAKTADRVPPRDRRVSSPGFSKGPPDRG